MILLVALTSSCKFFETERISSDDFYEEEMREIDWKDVDMYPMFEGCKIFTEKEDQKNCFERSLSNHLYASIRSRDMRVAYDINDTVPLEFSISNDGQVKVKNVRVDSSMRTALPLLELWIRESIDSLPEIIPAHKRGIPVNTEFTLPIVIRSNGS